MPGNIVSSPLTASPPSQTGRERRIDSLYVLFVLANRDAAYLNFAFDFDERIPRIQGFEILLIAMEDQLFESRTIFPFMGYQELVMGT
ncbi:MAG TPA: hypothetical protein DCS88_11860, partial [Alphaproteobacteria bacterium]|nr:hypothetical protein [Alphaproteobacteria bacterium]